MQLNGIISGRGQDLLRFNHFVNAAIYNHVQTSRNNAYRQTIEIPTTERTNVQFMDCDQHLRNSQLQLAIHPIAMAD